MSWELISFLILGAVLLSGFAWYERSRPPSQVVALVAALAALAIAGRIAFAAFPNVKPTTDIVIFAGYALGAAPGFAVGALTALVSNIWFGQGPWTPWQMAGWGMCGIFGAGLALGGRNAGRLTLAAACGFAGIAYGVLLNFSLMATYGGEFSLQRFLLLESRAVPFDAAHAIGNVALALVAGPAMVRMLVRFRERFEWRLPAVATSALLALILVASLPSTADAADDNAKRAALWLTSVQNGDGGFGGSPEDASSPSTTAWAALGFAAAGVNPLDVERNGHTPIDFLRAHVEELSSPGDFARTILALEAAGVDPHSFGGHDLVAALLKRRADNGSWVGWPGSTAFAVIALRAAGATGGLEHSLSWLAKAQNEDGGWGDLPQPPSTADGTGAVMQAMPDTDVALQGLGYLRRHQREGGGFVTGASGAINSQSTAWAVQGILAVGGSPGSFQQGGKSPLDYLEARQADNGHYRYSADSDQTPIWVTAQVLVAVSHKSFPVSTPARKPEPAPAVSGGKPAPGSAATPEAPSLTPPSSGGGVGAPPEGFAPSGPPALGTPPAPPSAGGREREGSGAALPPTSASQPVASADDPSPAAPLGIGLATGGLALGLPWWLGRRYGW
jgi:prenyltransferase/squalene oxidase-like repeat protein